MSPHSSHSSLEVECLAFPPILELKEGNPQFHSWFVFNHFPDLPIYARLSSRLTECGSSYTCFHTPQLKRSSYVECSWEVPAHAGGVIDRLQDSRAMCLGCPHSHTYRYAERTIWGSRENSVAWYMYCLRLGIAPRQSPCTYSREQWTILLHLPLTLPLTASQSIH